MNKVLQTLMIGINLTIILGGVYWVNSHDNTNDENRLLSEMMQEMKSIKTEVSALKDNDKKFNRLEIEIAKLKSGQSNQVSKNQTNLSEENVEEAAKNEEFNPSEIAKKQEAEQAKTLDIVNNAFLAEASDQAWSSEATQMVKGFFDSETGSKINLLDFECRKTLCKVEITNPQDPRINDNLMLSFPTYVSKSLNQASFFYEKNGDGTTNVIIFLVRNGYDLPKS